ncbi:hypothetical protein [Anaeromassilibacillus sp. SJQ-5]
MARDFFVNQGDLTLPYFMYGKENQRRVAEKDPPLGRFDIYQTRPSRRRAKKRGPAGPQTVKKGTFPAR